jgi:hypothetical protein
MRQSLDVSGPPCCRQTSAQAGLFQDQVIGSAGLGGRLVLADEMSWLMHRSCSLGLPAPRNLPAVPGAA